MTKTPSVADYLATLDPATRAPMDALRAVVAAGHPGLVEAIKWNAPSFAHGGEDRVTLGIERKGGFRVVLHRGARIQETATFRFEDRGRLARWPAPDRGVILLKDENDIAAKAETLAATIGQWIEACAQAK